jgi:hypothetical protein
VNRTLSAHKISVLIFALAALVLSTGYLLRSVPRASASPPEGPEVTGGTHPYKSFTGSTGATDVTVFTVPNDRIFVLTGACVGEATDILQGNDTKIAANSLAAYCGKFATTNPTTGTNFLAVGQGHIVFEPGTTVRIKSRDGTAVQAYALQGYLAHP